MTTEAFRVDLLHKTDRVCSHYSYSCFTCFTFLTVNMFLFKGTDLLLLIYLVIESIPVLETF